MNMVSGIRGFLVKHLSLERKKSIIRILNPIKQMIFGLSQGNVAPPTYSPERSRRVTAQDGKRPEPVEDVMAFNLLRVLVVHIQEKYGCDPADREIDSEKTFL